MDMGASHRQPDSETFRKEAKKEKDEKKNLMKEKEKGKRKKEKGKTYSIIQKKEMKWIIEISSLVGKVEFPLQNHNIAFRDFLLTECLIRIQPLHNWVHQLQLILI